MSGDDQGPPTAEEAEAIAGAEVDFRGTYGGPGGAAARHHWEMQQESQIRNIQTAEAVSRSRPPGPLPPGYVGGEVMPNGDVRGGHPSEEQMARDRMAAGVGNREDPTAPAQINIYTLYGERKAAFNSKVEKYNTELENYNTALDIVKSDGIVSQKEFDFLNAKRSQLNAQVTNLNVSKKELTILGEIVSGADMSRILANDLFNNDTKTPPQKEIVPGVHIVGIMDMSPPTNSTPGMEVAPGAFFTQEARERPPGMEVVPGVYYSGKVNNAAGAGLVVGVFGLGYGIQNWLSEKGDSAYSAASTLPNPSILPVRNLANAGVSASLTMASFIPFMLEAPLLVPAGATMVMENPAAAPAGAANVFTTMGSEIWQREQTNPGSFVGTVVGMYLTGKAIDFTAGKIPVGIKTLEVPIGNTITPTAEDTFYRSKMTGSPIVEGAYDQFFQNKEFGSTNKYTYLSVGKEPVIGFARGAEVEPQIFVGRQGITNIITNSHIEIPSPFGRESPYVWTPEQKYILSPIIGETAANSFTRAMVEMPTNLERANTNLNGKYVPAQPIGMSEQMGVDFATRISMQRGLSAGGKQSIMVGSGVLEIIGDEFHRDISMSDRDISASLPAQQIQYKILTKEFHNPNIEQNIYLRRNTLWDGTFDKDFQLKKDLPKATPDPLRRGMSFGQPNEEHLIGFHNLEGHPEVTGMPVPNIAGGSTYIQTPSNFIETKLSRTLGSGAETENPSVFKYDPKTGKSTIQTTGAKKEFNDLLDMYAMTRYMAKTAYENRLYGLGKTFEGTSEAIAGRANELPKPKVVYPFEDVPGGFVSDWSGQPIPTNVKMSKVFHHTDYIQQEGVWLTPEEHTSWHLMDTGKIPQNPEFYNKYRINNKLTPEDILEGVPRGPIDVGNALGVNLGGFKAFPEAGEYPTVAKPKEGGYGGMYPLILPTIMLTPGYGAFLPDRNYPESKIIPEKYPDSKLGGYPGKNLPVDYPWTDIPVPPNYPTWIPGHQPNYPTGTTPPPHDDYPPWTPPHNPDYPPGTPPPHTPHAPPPWTPQTPLPWTPRTPPTTIILPDDKPIWWKKHYKTKPKRFAEVFSFDVDDGFKMPEVHKTKGTNFQEIFSFDTDLVFKKSSAKSKGSKFNEIFSFDVGKS